MSTSIEFDRVVVGYWPAFIRASQRTRRLGKWDVKGLLDEAAASGKNPLGFKLGGRKAFIAAISRVTSSDIFDLMPDGMNGLTIGTRENLCIASLVETIVKRS